MEQSAASVLDIAARLLREVADGVAPLGAVSAALAALADALEVDRVVVAIDDPQFGRQLFYSGRRPPGESGVGLWGRAGVCTEPALPIDAGSAAMLRSAVRIAFTRAVERGQSRLAGGQTRPGELTTAIATATARAERYGWRFAFVLVGFDMVSDPGPTPMAPSLREGLRAGDTVVELGPGQFGLLIQATGDEGVPAILARIACRADLAPFSFGLVCCPGDGTDAEVLVELGFERLREAKLARSWERPASARATVTSDTFDSVAGRADARIPWA